jgi:transcription initiation factor TFIID TATA-box-binding protein
MEKLSNEHPRELTYTIQNIVVKSCLNQEIDLDHILTNVENCKYNSATFPGLFMRIPDPKCVILLFKSGNIIITGVLRFIHIPAIVEQLIFSLNQKTQYKINIDSITTEIVNIVITADYKQRIDLNLGILRLRNSLYEPEVFPGIIYKNKSPHKAVFLIFSTGKVVMTGIKNPEVIEALLIHLGKLLEKNKLFLEIK